MKYQVIQFRHPQPESRRANIRIRRLRQGRGQTPRGGDGAANLDAKCRSGKGAGRKTPDSSLLWVLPAGSRAIVSVTLCKIKCSRRGPEMLGRFRLHPSHGAPKPPRLTPAIILPLRPSASPINTRQGCLALKIEGSV